MVNIDIPTMLVSGSADTVALSDQQYLEPDYAASLSQAKPPVVVTRSVTLEELERS